MTDSEKRIPVLVISKWWETFENAKSRSVKSKTYGQFPLKHGLGYCNLMSRKDGPQSFGVFIALTTIIHSKEAEHRKGYLTTTGDETGYPLSFKEMELLTRIPEKAIIKAIKVLSHQSIGWIVADTMRIPEGYHEDTALTSKYTSTVLYCIESTVQRVADSRKATSVSLPEIELPYNSKAFLEAWDGLMEVRRAKKAPNTHRALVGIINKLAEIAPNEREAIRQLDRAIQGGWKTVFPDNNRDDKPDPEAARARQKEEERRRGEEALRKLTRPGFVEPEDRQ